MHIFHRMMAGALTTAAVVLAGHGYFVAAGIFAGIAVQEFIASIVESR